MENKSEFIIKFIELYRGQTCLWDVKDEHHKNRMRKEQAYRHLLQFYRKTAPLATVDTVKKKINNLRSAFRKELKKVRAQRNSSGYEAYKPTLCYYNSLKFLIDQEELGETTECEETFVIDSVSNPIKILNARSLTPSPELSPSQTPISPVPSSAESVALTPTSNKRIERLIKKQERKRPFDTKCHPSWEEDEFDGIGINVACKLRRMGEEQRMYAEKLIHKALFDGLRGLLQEETHLCALEYARSEVSVRQTDGGCMSRSSSFDEDHLQQA